jgi:hypothetical protein
MHPSVAEIQLYVRVNENVKRGRNNMHPSAYEAELYKRSYVKEELRWAEQQRLAMGKGQPRWHRLQRLGEQFDAWATTVGAWFAGPPEPGQECC